MVKAFLVDDEEHALNILQILLERIGGVTVAGRSSNAFEALDTIIELRPDVIFLDIEMPGMNGVELAERIRNKQMGIQIVFVTAYDRYAVSAFEKEAVDYILKPLEMDRLTRTVERIKREVAKRAAPLPNGTEVMPVKFNPAPLTIQTLGGFEVINERNERLKWRTAKEKELFAFLLLQGEARVHRDVILDALWQDENQHKAKIYLHTCISYLRKDLNEFGFANMVMYEDEKYYLNIERLVTDVHVLRSRMNALIQSGGAASSDRSGAFEMEKVLALYPGPLFKNEDYVWAEQEIQHLDKAVFDLKLLLAEVYYKQEQFVRTTELAGQILSYSPYCEEAYRLLMRCCLKTGKHDEVFRLYQELVQVLDELQIEPSELTKEVYNEIVVK